jgi:hypothetical protein
MNALLPIAVSALILAASAAAQDPLVPRTPPPAIEHSDDWTEGFGRANNYRSALAQALEDAVGRAKGIAVARGAGVRSRLSVIADSTDKMPEGWFDGDAEEEKEWVQHQIAGFVKKYEIVKKEQSKDGAWEITVRAQIAGTGAAGQKVVVDLADNDVTAWKLERYEEDGAGEPFDRSVAGKFDGTRISQNLRASGVIEIAAKAAAVAVGDGAAPDEREKAGQRLVASHRVTVEWQPMVFKSLVERPNVARPTSGPRPQYLTSAAVQVTVKIVDLVRDVELYDRPMTISLDLAPTTPVDRLDAFVVQLADKAKAAVAGQIVFTLKPPVVTRKWAGDGGEWFVEASLPRRIAQGYTEFVVGNNGSLASPDWKTVARATLVGGDDTKCTFKLLSADDPSAIEPDISEVRPGKV